MNVLERSVRNSIGLVVLASLCLPSILTAQEVQPAPEAAFKRLKDGNARFAADQLAKKDVGSKRRAELAKGQRPFAVILTCADSRVAPELIFDQGLGDLFVLRVAGNVSNPDILGSIEYAVTALQAPLIVVLGHSQCGAVAAAINGKPLEGNLGKLIERVHVGKELPKDRDAALAAGIKANVLYHTQELTKQSKVLEEFVSGQRVRIEAGVYSLKTGEVDWLEVRKAKEQRR